MITSYEFAIRWHVRREEVSHHCPAISGYAYWPTLKGKSIYRCDECGQALRLSRRPKTKILRQEVAS